MAILLAFDPLMLEHDNGAGHPECRERLEGVVDAIRAGEFPVRWVAPGAATEAQLRRVHTVDHVRRLAACRGASCQLDGDTRCSPRSYDAALLAAGAAVAVVDAVIDGDVQSGFALVRPPGHHAEPDRAMGFCLFNNVAVAAAHAIAGRGCERVLIVDFDVHHGNGTQRAFESRRDVLLFSMHQWPHYPGTGAAAECGAGAGRGSTVNVPLPAGRSDADYLAVMQRLLVPIADRFAPDLVLVSAGFDAHRDDPLGGMNVTESGFAAMVSLVRGIARRHAHCRLGLVLEGGYDRSALARSVVATMTSLGEDDPSAPAPAAASPEVESVIDQVARHHHGVWPGRST